MGLGLAYWNKKNAEYPFHVQEDRAGNRVPFTTRYKDGLPQQTVNEHDEYRAKYGDFLRCPAPEIGVVFWGFLTEAALQRFIADFGLTDERGKGGPA